MALEELQAEAEAAAAKAEAEKAELAAAEAAAAKAQAERIEAAKKADRDKAATRIQATQRKRDAMALRRRMIAQERSTMESKLAAG